MKHSEPAPSSVTGPDEDLLSLDRERERQLTRTVLRKLDLHVLPPLAIAGLESDTHLRGNQFNIGLAVFYITYIIVELPSNWVLKKIQPNRWLPILVFCWGIVTTLSGLIQNFGGLVAIRMVLGLCEGGILPGIVLYLSTLYKPHELQLRRVAHLTVGVFYASGAFGGLLATAILKMDGVAGEAGWRWIFILEGIATCVIAIGAAIILPASLEAAKFFTEDERSFALHRFRSVHLITASAAVAVRNPSPSTTDPEKVSTEAQAQVYDALKSGEAPVIIHQEEEQFEWREVVRGLLDIQAWVTGFAYFGIIVCLYSFSLFLPTIIAGLGYTGGEAQLRTVPPYIPAVVLTVVVAFMADRYRLRGPIILMCLPFTIAGYILVIAATTNEARYGAVFLIAAGLYPSAPCILSILPNNSSGHYKKATTVALQLAIANTGGFVATFAYTKDQAPRYIKGHSIVLGFVCIAWLLVGANVLYCRWENRARAAGSRQSNIEEYQALWDSGKTRAPIGDRHPDFRYTL
ncbi:MFS transporter [Auriscalpium vulgare]|uniref:MFS transporter n=1 Tax=Auriscalpium vulgare TaxID=40419 RepID=A0ACB8SAX7_9AGAM|nr:MFS transporter [Auriscalpium vulgare]